MQKILQYEYAIIVIVRKYQSYKTDYILNIL